MLDLTELGDWRPPIVETVASTGEGVQSLWAAVAGHREHQISRGTLVEHRRRRLDREFRQVLAARVEQEIARLRKSDQYSAVTDAMLAGDVDPYEAADRILAVLLADRNDDDEAS
jgi:LAO/AO transport system kinase